MGTTSLSMVLGMPTHGVVVAFEVLGDLGRLRVRVVAADRVEDGHLVHHELLRRSMEGFSPSTTSPRFTQSSTFVSLTRELPIGEPPCNCRTEAFSRTASVTLTCSPDSNPL